MRRTKSSQDGAIFAKENINDMILKTGYYQHGQVEDMILCEDSLYDYEDDEFDRGCLSNRWRNETLYVDVSNIWD